VHYSTLLLQVRETLEHAARLGSLPDEHYPYAELSICIGYLVVYFIEVLIHSLMGHDHGGHGHSHGMVASPTEQTVVEDGHSHAQMRAAG
jgi:hypothetical protein